jgi:hypothetical protein
MKMSNGTSRSLVVLVSLISLVLGYDCYNYWSLPPLLRVANLEALKHPYSDRIEADDAFKKHMPIGSDQKFVLDSFQNSEFTISLVDINQLPSDDERRLRKDHQYYWGRAVMPAGLIKKALLFANYETHVSLDFSNGKLSNITVFIFLNTL